MISTFDLALRTYFASSKWIEQGNHWDNHLLSCYFHCFTLNLISLEGWIGFFFAGYSILQFHWLDGMNGFGFEELFSFFVFEKSLERSRRLLIRNSLMVTQLFCFQFGFIFYSLRLLNLAHHLFLFILIFTNFIFFLPVYCWYITLFLYANLLYCFYSSHNFWIWEHPYASRFLFEILETMTKLEKYFIFF